MIIGLTGYARHGKNTVAQYLVEKHGFKQMAFADGVREMALAIDPLISCYGYGMADSTFYTLMPNSYLSRVVETVGWEIAKQNPEIRRLLQRIGTEGGREIFGPNCWIDLLQRKIQESVIQNIVISDCRFPNEADAIKRLQGQVWRIHRPNFNSGVSREHPSEASIDEIHVDTIIKNDLGLDDLKARVEDALDFLRVTGEFYDR
jgi:hypothetical protein